MPRYIGKSIPRLEDERFVTGHGRYTNDIPPPDACFAYVLRSPHAHARIRAIRVEAARAHAHAASAAHGRSRRRALEYRWCSGRGR